MSLREKDININMRTTKAYRDTLRRLATKRGLYSSELVHKWIENAAKDAGVTVVADRKKAEK
jgi:hypothetical protein